MATSYPGGVDNFTNPTASDALDSATVPHATQHANANDAIEAIETELGVNPSGAFATVKDRLDGVEGKTVNVTSPLTGGGSISSNPTIGLNQALLSVQPSQVVGTAVITSDPRLSDTRSPSAHAASHTSAGSDPLTLAQSQVTNLVSDLASKVASSDSRLSDTRVPTDGSVTPAKIQAGGLPTSAISGTAVVTGDARLSDARTPLNHAASHTAGGGDAISITAAQVSDGAATFARLGAANTFTVGNQFISNAVAADVPLTIRGAASQSNALTAWNDSTNTQVARVDQTGSVRAGSFGSTASGKALLTPNGAANGFLISTNGAANSGLVISGSSGQSANLTEWKDSAGSVIARVDSSGRFNSTTAGNFGGISAGLAFLAVQTSAATVGAIVRGGSGQTADLQQWQNSTGTVLARISSSGDLVTGGVQGVYASTFTAGNASTRPMTVKGAAAQTANLFEVQDSAGTALARIRPDGAVAAAYLDSVAAGGPYVTLGSTYFGIMNRNASHVPLYIRAAAAQVQNLQEWQNSAGTNLAGISAAGFGFFGLTGASAGQVSVQTSSAATVGLLVRGAAAQTANLLELQNSAGTILVRITNNGNSYMQGITGTSGRGWLYPSADSGTAFKIGDLAAATVKGLVIQGTASQSADLQQWQDSSNNVLAKVTSAGAVHGVTVQTANGYVRLGEVNSGGAMTMVKQLAATVNPGADTGRIYFRDGTNAGTLKLVVRAGAAGAETTILDNIPQ